MGELEDMLARSLHGAAEHAPSDSNLLGNVHRRSKQQHRRRIVTVSASAAAAAVLAVGVPFAVVSLERPGPDRTPPAVLPAPSGSPSLVVTPSSPPPSSPSSSSPPPPVSTGKPSTPSTSGSSASLRLVSGWTAPTFPYTLPATSGMKAPVASMKSGNPVAFFEATDTQNHSDITITVSPHKPTFTGTATSSPAQVRGHAGTLRTQDVRPAKQYTLSWQESSTRWITLATDDTYSTQQVVDLADSLTAASIAVLPPFDLDYSPSGLATDTVSESTMSFGGGKLTAVLHKHRTLAGPPVTVGAYQATLTRTSGTAVLDVDVTDWNATLEITATGVSITDADLERFAAGVHVLNRSNPI